MPIPARATKATHPGKQRETEREEEALTNPLFPQQIRDAQLRQVCEQQQRIGRQATRVELLTDDTQHGWWQDQHCGSGL